MLDDYTLDETIKYIEHRVEKIKRSMVLYKKDSGNYLIYKSLIMELTNLKYYLGNKRSVKNERNN